MSQVSFNRRITDMRFATAVIRYELNGGEKFETERLARQIERPSNPK